MKKGKWSPHLNLSRASVRWFSYDHQEIVPNRTNLERLMESKNGYARVTSPPGKADQLGNGSSARFPAILPLGAPGVIQPALQLLRIELRYPVPVGQRKQYPLFTDPETGFLAFRTKDFDEFVIWIIGESIYYFQGERWSEQQIRKMFSLHSFRIGGTCALRTVGAPKHVRMMAGRWLSEAMGEYDREEVEELIKYMGAQQIATCELINGQPADLPTFARAKSTPVGGSYLVDENETPNMEIEESWNKPLDQPRAEIQQIYRQGTTIQLLLEALTTEGPKITKAGNPIRRWCQGKIKSLDFDSDKPITVKFNDRRRADLTLTWAQWADMKFRARNDKSRREKGGNKI